MKIGDVGIRNPLTWLTEKSAPGVIPASDTMASAGKKESCGGCISGCLCFFPNLIWKCIKKVINILSCNTLCVEGITTSQFRAEVKRVLEILRDTAATQSDREAAVRSLSAETREKIVEGYVARKKEAQLGKKPSEEQRRCWDEEQADVVREETLAKMNEAEEEALRSILAAADAADAN
jgi:hypothetical protein